MEGKKLDESQRLCLDPDGGVPRLLEIMRRLRDPEHGCAWDREQDFRSISAFTIEEAHEVADAILREDWTDLESELGDLLLQSVYHAQIGNEKGLFDFDSIVRGISDKMVERHPHVFGDGKPTSSQALVSRQWEAIKASERKSKGNSGTMSGIALGLPSLTHASKIQQRAARVGFDWPGAEEMVEKIVEEASELVSARSEGNDSRIEEEFGDLLFAIANLARHIGVDPEASLRFANAKFLRRFERMESIYRGFGIGMDEVSNGAMEAAWRLVKIQE